MCGIDYNFNHTDSNLPEFLGGNKREFAFAQTIFPGDCYQAAVMTHQYTYYFLSKAKLKQLLPLLLLLINVKYYQK